MSLYQPLQNPIYTTPAVVKDILGVTATSTGDDALLLSFCEESSRKIDEYCNRTFFPRYQTLKLDYQRDPFNITLPDDLISLVTLTNGDGNEIPATSGSTTVIYYYPPSEYPKYRISLGWNSGYVFLFSGTFQQCTSVNALWGYPAYENTGTWKTATAATVQNAVSQSASATTLLAPTGSFYAGTTLYIDDEFEIIQSVTTGATNDTLTVTRGQCGSTAAVHTNGTAIYQVLIHPTIVRAMWRLTSWAFWKRTDTNQGTTGITQMGTLVVPDILPKDVTDILDTKVRRHI